MEERIQCKENNDNEVNRMTRKKIRAKTFNTKEEPFKKASPKKHLGASMVIASTLAIALPSVVEAAPQLKPTTSTDWQETVTGTNPSPVDRDRDQLNSVQPSKEEEKAKDAASLSEESKEKAVTLAKEVDSPAGEVGQKSIVSPKVTRLR